MFPSVSNLPPVLPENVVLFATRVPIRSKNRKVVMSNRAREEMLATARQCLSRRALVVICPFLPGHYPLPFQDGCPGYIRLPGGQGRPSSAKIWVGTASLPGRFVRSRY